MRITRLKADGVKQATCSHDLKPVTVFTGNNFSGKTARLDAIRLGLIGYLPELGKTASSTFALAANGEMSVGLTFGDGSELTRSWRREGKSVKMASSGELSVPTVLIDPSEYFSLGDKDRVRYVFKLAAAHLEGVADSVISKIKSIKIDGHGPNHEAAIDELVSLVDESDRQRHDLDVPVPQWIEQLIADVRERLKASKAEADKMAKTVTGMATIEAMDEAAARNVKTELDAKRKLLEKALGDHGKLASELRGAQLQKDRRAKLLIQLVNLPTDTERLEELKAKSAAVLKTALMPRKTAICAATKIEAQSAHAKAEAAFDQCEKRLGQLKAEFDKKRILTKCPFCGASGDGWQKELEAEYEFKIAEETRLLRSLDETANETAAVLKKADEAMTKAQKRDAEIDAAGKELRGLTAEIEKLQKVDSERAATQAALDATPDVDVSEKEKQVASVEDDIQKLRTQVSTLNQKHDEFVRQQQGAVLAAKASERYELVKATVSVQAEAVKMLEALQSEMVKQAFGSIIDMANLFTNGILKGTLAYHDGEIGRWQDGRWISHHSFSGTEKALAYAGISVALASQSPLKIVLLDEMGRLTRENKALVIDRLVNLIEHGDIDQAVCVDVDAADYTASKLVDVVTI